MLSVLSDRRVRYSLNLSVPFRSIYSLIIILFYLLYFLKAHFMNTQYFFITHIFFIFFALYNLLTNEKSQIF